jgi:dephospho-CoA kinase
MLAFNQAFEARAFALASSNRRVADATMAMLLADWPAPLRPGLGRLLAGLLCEREAACLGWSLPPSPLQGLMLAGLRLRSRLAALSQSLRPPQPARFYSERPTPSYGAQFQLDQLGPPARLAALNRPRWGGRQRRIGLTGGIASGKSTVARLLADQQGLPILDADVYAREALAPGRPATLAVLARYGERVRGPAAADSIDRAALGRIVFAEPRERHWLEQLLHPLVRQRFETELVRLAAEPALLLVIPLLFEAGLEGLCREIWLVDCDEAQQRQRLMTRDGLNAAEAEARLAAQWPLSRKRGLADRLIDNRKEPATLAALTAAAWRGGA